MSSARLTESQFALLERLSCGPIPVDKSNAAQEKQFAVLRERGLAETFYGVHRKRDVWRLTPAGWTAVQQFPTVDVG